MGNNQAVLPPRHVYEACLRGLKRYDRLRAITLDTGATAAAISFAEIAGAGRPVDTAMAAEVLEAHRLLDCLPRRPDGLTEQEKISRLLWGGDDAPDWAAAVLEADRTTIPEATPDPPAAPPGPPAAPPGPPVVVAAATPGDSPQACVDRLTDDLFNIDTETIAGLRAAFWVAYRTALRSATSTTNARSHRVPKADQIAAGLGAQELNAARQAIRAAGPFDGYRAVPDRIAAVISVELETAVESALDDYHATATALLLGATDRAAAMITRALDVPRADVDELLPAVDNTTQAATQLRADLLAWIQARGQDRDPEDITDLVAPEDTFVTAVSTAGGSAPGDEDESIGAPLLGRVLGAVATGAVVSRALSAAANLLPHPEWEWVYGDPATRVHGPYPDHLALAGRTWTDDEERTARIGTNRPRTPHAYCQCRIKKRWRLGGT